MKELFIKNSIAITIAIFVLVVIPSGYFGTRHLLQKIEGDVEVLQTKKIDQQVQHNFLLNAQTLSKQKQFIEQSSGEIDVLLSEEDVATIELYTKIEALSDESQNSDTRLNVEQYTGVGAVRQQASPTAGRGVPEKNLGPDAAPVEKVEIKAPFSVAPASDKFLYLSVQTVGTYNNFLSFVHKLENMEYFSDIIQIELQSHANGEITRGSSDRTTSTDTRDNLVAGRVRIAFYLSGGFAREERLADPATGLNSQEMLGL